MNKKIVVTKNLVLTQELKNEWNRLSEISEMSHYFNSLEWFLTCLDAFSYKDFSILTARVDGKLVGLLPLIKGRNFGIPFFKNPGEKFIDRSALLLLTQDRKVVSKMTKFLEKMGSFFLTELTEESAQLASRKKYLIKIVDTNFYLPLDGDIECYMSSRSKKNINKLIIHNQNDLSFKQFGSSAFALKLVEQVARNSSKSLKNIESFDEDVDKNFFDKLIANNSELVKINVLYFRKVPVSFEIGLLFNNIYYGLNTSFDFSYKELNPGKMIEYYLIDYLKEQKVKVFDFSRGDDNVKRALTNLSKTQYDLYHFNNKFTRYIVLFGISSQQIILNNRFLYKNYRSMRSLQFKLSKNALLALKTTRRYFLSIDTTS